MKTFFRYWLPSLCSVLLLLVFAMVCLQTCGHRVYIIDGEKYPWIVNAELVARLDTTYTSTARLLAGLEKEGLVMSPQEFTNHTHSFFSWLLTVLVAVIGIMALAFGYNVDKRIKETVGEIEKKIADSVGNTIKSKWLELMRVDKEVDSTIGGIIDDKIGETVSDIKNEFESMKKRLDEIGKADIIFTDENNEEE